MGCLPWTRPRNSREKQICSAPRKQTLGAEYHDIKFVGSVARSPDFFLFGNLDGAYLVIHVTRNSCFSCIKKRILSSEYLSPDDYSRLTAIDVRRIMRLLEKTVIPPATLVEFRGTIVGKYRLLPVPGCKHDCE